MAHYAENFGKGGVFSPLLSLFPRIVEAIARRRIYNKTYAELNALSSRELDDLGISRSMVSRLAQEAAQE